MRDERGCDDVPPDISNIRYPNTKLMMREAGRIMRIAGRVRQYDADDGWGIIDSIGTPGGCWVGFADIRMDGYRTLEAGSSVVAEVEAISQDGYDFRAVNVWPAGVPVGYQPPPPPPASEGAYYSRLTVTDEDGNEVPSK